MQISKCILSFVVLIKYNTIVRVLLRLTSRRLCRLLDAIRIELVVNVPIAVGGAASVEIAPVKEGNADLIDEPALGNEGFVYRRTAADDTTSLLIDYPTICLILAPSSQRLCHCHLN
jgi:hypothetical protein